MELHDELNDAEFERQFRNCSLDPKLFTHEAHLRLAWIHISNYGIKPAIDNISEQLQAFVSSIGARGKYNHTLTIAAIKAVHHFYLKSNSKTFSDFIAEFPRLKTQFRELMHLHYAIDIFTSERAKNVFIEPDRVPFE